MSRRRFSSEFKAKVALEAIKAHRTVNELAQEFGVHEVGVKSFILTKYQPAKNTNSSCKEEF